MDIVEYNHLTGEVVERQFTVEEKALQNNLVIHGQEEIDAKELELQNAYAKRLEAIQALVALGLSEEQANALGGI